jgi:8-oxo-dGTP pyrophosphatase MutT (NUDIX family)
MAAMPMSPYVAAIRAKIGTDLLLMPAAGTAVFDDDGRLLMGHHVDTGAWATIGGAIDPGESPAEAARREMREETGLEVELVGLVGAYGGPDFQVTYANGDRSAYTVVLFAGRLTGGTFHPHDGEISEIGWFTADRAARLPMRADMRRLVPDAFTWWQQHPTPDDATGC